MLQITKTIIPHERGIVEGYCQFHIANEILKTKGSVMKKIIILFTLIVCMVFTTSMYGQFSGGTYTIGTAGGENYSSLLSACAALNAAGSLGGDVIFEITTDLTEADNVPLGVNTNGYTLTFRPSEDVDKILTFTQATKNTGPQGSFVLGTTTLTDFTGLISTDNIIIDGYSSGGSTRRLTFKTSNTTSHILNSPIIIIANSNLITIKNCIVTHSPKVSSGFPINFAVGLYTYYSAGTGTLTPDNITVDNCILTAQGSYSTAFGTYYAGSSSISVLPSNCVVKNNTISAGFAGIYLAYCGAIDVYNNTFSINQTLNLESNGIYIYNASKNSSGTSNIYNNNFIQLSSSATSSSYPSTYIQIVSHNGINLNIYNNMMSGFSRPISSSSGTINITGIITDGADVNRNVNVVYNTILMNDIGSTGGTFDYFGIVFNGNTEERISNNIISIQESDFDAFAMKQLNPNLTGEDPVCNYNVAYLGTGTAKWGVSLASYSTLAEWQTATSLDANSKSKAVTFVSTSDLHLFGSSLGDLDLIGTPISGITTDIDGETRHATLPYMGADENLANPLPVELTSFTASVLESKVILNWQTATEVNNYGFEIERQILNQVQNDNWEKIGFVAGSGNSFSPKEYTFTDELTNVSADSVKYRIKQIDTDGNYEYYGTILVVSLANITDIDEATQVTEFALFQNYPNPFNPSTTIRYSIPNVIASEAKHSVVLKVYDILGNEVATLVNENKSAGNYEVKFDGSNLSSGIYFYKLQSGSFVQTKKFILIK